MFYPLMSDFLTELLTKFVQKKYILEGQCDNLKLNGHSKLFSSGCAKVERKTLTTHQY